MLHLTGLVHAGCFVQLRHKELAMLCFLKDVSLDRSSLEVTVKTLM